MSQKKKKGSARFVDPMEKSKEQEEAELTALKNDIEDERLKKDAIEFSNAELEKSVRSVNC